MQLSRRLKRRAPNVFWRRAPTRTDECRFIIWPPVFVIADGLTLAVSASCRKWRSPKPERPLQLQDWQIMGSRLALLHALHAVLAFSTSTAPNRYILADMSQPLAALSAVHIHGAADPRCRHQDQRELFPGLVFFVDAVSLGLVLLGAPRPLHYIRRAMSRGAYVYKALSIGVFAIRSAKGNTEQNPERSACGREPASRIS